MDNDKDVDEIHLKSYAYNVFVRGCLVFRHSILILFFLCFFCFFHLLKFVFIPLLKCFIYIVKFFIVIHERAYPAKDIQSLIQSMKYLIKKENYNYLLPIDLAKHILSHPRRL